MTRIQLSQVAAIYLSHDVTRHLDFAVTSSSTTATLRYYQMAMGTCTNFWQ